MKNSIVWKTQSYNPAIASVRYRCLLPALYLSDKGYESIILQGTEDIDLFDDLQALIFVKTFSKHDYLLAKKAHQNGVPVVLDLCDNIFVKNYSNSNNFSEFDAMSKLATAIITTGSELSKIIQQRIGAKNVLVIPDQVETLESVQKSYLMVMQWRKSRYRLMGGINKIDSFIKANKYRLSLKKLVVYCRVLFAILRKYFFQYINRPLKALEAHHDLNPTYKRIIWFGNHGAPHSNFGMGSLLLIKKNLEEINRTAPIELTVISNNIEKFNNLIQPFPIKTRYKKWTALTIFKDISEADLCVLPSYNDEFSLCKSPNRTLLSLSLGVPVVATAFPAIEELSGCIILDDWDTGLSTYLNNEDRVFDDVNKAKKIIKDRFSADSVGEKWNSLLKQIRS